MAAMVKMKPPISESEIQNIISLPQCLSVPTPEPEQYSGGEDFIISLDRMDDYLSRCPEAAKSQTLLNRLSTEVYAVARSTGCASSTAYAELSKRLRELFEGDRSFTLSFLQLRRRYWRSGETTADFMRDVMKLVWETFPDRNQNFRDELVSMFVLSGLGSESVDRHECLWGLAPSKIRSRLL